MTGLPPNEQYDVSDEVPFSSAPPLSVDEALKEAINGRSDLKSAEAQVQAAERARSAAKSRTVSRRSRWAVITA